MKSRRACIGILFRLSTIARLFCCTLYLNINELFLSCSGGSLTIKASSKSTVKFVYVVWANSPFIKMNVDDCERVCKRDVLA